MAHLVRRAVRRPNLRPRFHCTSPPPPPSNPKLFVGGLSWSVDEKSLKDAFSSFGEVTEVIGSPRSRRGHANPFWKFKDCVWTHCKVDFVQKSMHGSVRIMYDKSSGRSRGFGFVHFSTDNEAKCAKEAMDGKALLGRPLRISFALEKVRGGPVVVPRLSSEESS